MSASGLSTPNLRVKDAATALGLAIAIDLSDAPTRTAEEAAHVRGCHVGQIVKSLIFRGSRQRQSHPAAGLRIESCR